MSPGNANVGLPLIKIFSIYLNELSVIFYKTDNFLPNGWIIPHVTRIKL